MRKSLCESRASPLQVSGLSGAMQTDCETCFTPVLVDHCFWQSAGHTLVFLAIHMFDQPKVMKYH